MAEIILMPGLRPQDWRSVDKLIQQAARQAIGNGPHPVGDKRSTATDKFLIAFDHVCHHHCESSRAAEIPSPQVFPIGWCRVGQLAQWRLSGVFSGPESLKGFINRITKVLSDGRATVWPQSGDRSFWPIGSPQDIRERLWVRGRRITNRQALSRQDYNDLCHDDLKTFVWTFCAVAQEFGIHVQQTESLLSWREWKEMVKEGTQDICDRVRRRSPSEYHRYLCNDCACGRSHEDDWSQPKI